ncbi:MAG: hypothetical protein ABJE95_07875 [Byssovorax sp.]
MTPPDRARRALLVIASLAALTACSAATNGPTDPPAWLAPTDGAKKDLTSGTALERYFPIVDGKIYHYVTENEMGEAGLLIARASRTGERAGQLHFPTGSKRFEYAPDGITVTVDGASVYVLKQPLAVGTTWRGEHGGATRILSIAAAVDVPLGHFDGCVQTLEERGGDRPVRYATTFCPGVGVVLLEASSGVSLERASLKSYDSPIEVGLDGTDKFQTTPPGPGPPPR